MADQGTFDARIAELAERVGTGPLVGTLTRDQVYAQYQHEDLTLSHPAGGQAKYQETALFTGHRGHLQGVADAVLDGDMVRAMAHELEQFDRASGRLTPKDLTILARSGHPQVRSGGRVVYDRAPEVPRLSDDELAALHGRVRGFTNVPSVGRSNRPGR